MQTTGVTDVQIMFFIIVSSDCTSSSHTTRLQYLKLQLVAGTPNFDGCYLCCYCCENEIKASNGTLQLLGHDGVILRAKQVSVTMIYVD